MELNKQKTALSLGFSTSLFHFVWLVLVALGLGQWLLDFIFNLHQLNDPYTVQPLNLGTGLLLLIITFAVGYVIGWVFSTIWNKLHT